MDSVRQDQSDLAQPLLPASGGDEEVAGLEEGRSPLWWDRQTEGYVPTALDSPALSAFARVQDSAPGSPTGSGNVSLKYSPRSHTTAGIKKGVPKPAPRETRARRTTWLVINSHGIKATFTSDKRGLIQKFRLGVPIRDMRLLDPNLLTSETGKILVRDNAIVFSVEHVRLIITADSVIIPQTGFERSPLSNRFAAMLEESIIEASQEKQAKASSEVTMARDREDDGLKEFDGEFSDDSSGFRHEAAVLPFELQVLETAIGDVCALCSQLVKELEANSHPALDALTKHVSTSNLERVRKVKTRHQRLLARVTTVREELQRFLEDDDDMAKMCLTRKKEIERKVSIGAATGERASGGLPLGSFQRRSLSINMHHPSSAHRMHSLSFAMPSADSPPGQGGNEAQMEDDSEESIEAVENMLESYFMQIDSSYDRLVSIGEFIKDTEEYINIELDSSRNRLIRLEIVLTAGTFGVAIFSLVAGILGENLILPPSITQTVLNFAVVNGVTLAFCLLVFASILGYIRYRRLM